MLVARPAPFCLLATSHGSLIVNRNDVHQSEDGNRFGVGYQLMASSRCEPEDTLILCIALFVRKKHFGPGVVAIDAGANIGTMTIPMATSCTGWGRVIAVEPQERLYYALAGNIALNNCFNASAMHGALGASPGSIMVPRIDYTKPGSYGSLELRPREGVEEIGQPIDRQAGDLVHMATVDQLALPRLDLLKIDVEGMEFEVLSGAERTIERDKPVMLIEHLKLDEHDLAAALARWGYVLLWDAVNCLAIHPSDPGLEELRAQFEKHSRKKPQEPHS